MVTNIYFVVLIYLIYVILSKHKSENYVELSVSSPSYYLYLPIIIRAWKLLNVDSIVIIVCHKITDDLFYLKSILQKYEAKIIFKKINASFSLHLASKLSRIYAFAIYKRGKNDDFFLLSDADMIPISYKFFNDYNYDKLTIKSFGKYGYGYGNNKGRWAMCYMVANKKIWMDILKNDINFNKMQYIIEENLINLLKKGKKYFEEYTYIDEVYVRDRIREWKMYNTNTLFHTRNYGKTRIDRSSWPYNISKVDMTNIIDIHLPHLPKNTKELLYIWNNKIIPLQRVLFHKNIFDIQYIKTMMKLNELFYI